MGAAHSLPIFPVPANNSATIYHLVGEVRVLLEGGTGTSLVCCCYTVLRIASYSQLLYYDNLASGHFRKTILGLQDLLFLFYYIHLEGDSGELAACLRDEKEGV